MQFVVDMSSTSHKRKSCRCRHEKHFMTYIDMLFQLNGTLKYLRNNEIMSNFSRGKYGAMDRASDSEYMNDFPAWVWVPVVTKFVWSFFCPWARHFTLIVPWFGGDVKLSVLHESNPRFPYKSTMNIILMNSSVHMLSKQLEIFLFTCLQNLLVFSNQVQIKSNIHWFRKPSLKLVSEVTKLDEIWHKTFLNNKSSILLVYMPIMPLV